MKIKTKLLFIAGFSALAIIVLGIFLYFSLHSYNLAIVKNETANQITHNIFENNLLLSEYLLYYEDRPRDLWVNKNDSTVALVKFQSAKFSKDSEKEIINNLLEVIGKNQKTFLELVASRDGDSKNGAEQQARLSAQILINNQEAVSSAGQLAVISSQDADVAQKTAVYFLVGFVALIFIIVSIILYFIWLSIVEPLIKLKEATVRIASLDFSTTTTTTTTTTTPSNDEMGQLARAFNTMTGKLKESYASLQSANIATQNVLEDLSIEKSEIKKAKAKDEAVLSSIGDGIIAVDSNGKIIIMNKAAEKLLGWQINEAIGKLYDDIVLLEDERGTFVPLKEKPLHKALDSSTTTTTTTTTTVLYLLSKNKIKFPVAITVSPIILDDKIIGAVEVFRDISKEKAVDKAKTEFVSLASHQLRTPLSTVNWYAEMLLAGDVGKLNEGQKKYLDEVYRSNQRMVELVNALLNVSRIELGTFVIEPKPTDVVELARSVMDEQKPQIDEKRIKFSPSFEKSIPLAQADPKLLRMVVQNLLSNAVKYTSEGGKIELVISLVDKKNIQIKISDTGYGIPKNQQDKIFTKLFRADNVREKDTEGTGLGLYIVKSIIEHSGGEIWFESEENKGTTFYMVLPLEGIKKKEGTKALS